MSFKLRAVGRVIKRRETWDIRKNTNYRPNGKLQVLQMRDITNSGLQKLSWHSKAEHLFSDLIYYPNYVFCNVPGTESHYAAFHLFPVFAFQRKVKTLKHSRFRWQLDGVDIIFSDENFIFHQGTMIVTNKGISCFKRSHFFLINSYLHSTNYVMMLLSWKFS